MTTLLPVDLTSVLVVDDEPAVRSLMARWVTSLGLRASVAGSSDEALAACRSRHHDLAVIDVMMPGRNGLWLATELRRDHPRTALVLATAYTELLAAVGADVPIVDLLIKPFRRDRFALAVDRGRDWRRQAVGELDWQARLSEEVRALTDLVRRELARGRAAGADEAELLLGLLEDQLPTVASHGRRVARYAVSLAHELGVSDVVVASIEQAALFEDIGKLALPEPLLTKPSALTPGETAIMRRHVNAGAEILAATVTLRDLAPIVRASHEWFGGGGYPSMIGGAAIPFHSRLLAVVDAYDSMTHDRPVPDRLDRCDVVSELLRCSPTQFDPEIVVAFLTTISRQ